MMPLNSELRGRPDQWRIRLLKEFKNLIYYYLLSK